MINVLHSKILGDGFPLLILHGLFGMSDNWMTLGRQFSDDYQVHLIDLRNHGRSFHDEVMNYEAMTQDLVVYCSVHHLKKIAVIGHSMGGKVAMLLAVKHPDLVQKLIIADIAPKIYPDRHSFIFKALQSVDFNIVKSRTEVQNILSLKIENPGIVQFLLKNVYHPMPGKLAFRFNLPVIHHHYKLMNENLPSDNSYQGKTLFLKGQLSDFISSIDESEIKNLFPNSEIKEITKAGHWLHAENPAEFYRECLNFLKTS